MTAAPATSDHFDFGRVVSNTFSVVGGNFRELLILALLLIGLPAALLTWGQLTVTGAGEAGISAMAGGFLALLIGYLGTLVGSTLLQAATVRVTVATLNGDSASAFKELRKSISAVVPLFFLGIVMGIGIMFGLVFVIVPGLILIVIWMVAAPVCVIERPGVFASLSRSRNLTRGHRWPIFGLLVVYAVAYFVISMMLSGIVAVGASAAGGLTALTAASLIASTITSTLGGVVTAAGIAAVYYELRVIKEGVGAAQLAAVFD